jgi:CheY-like chemotaxis protein
MTTVLVVDDSPVDRAFVVDLLSGQSGWEIQSAASGVAALDQMETTTPDVVVTDMQMPKMNGLQLVTTIRRQHPGVPVILMTAFGSETLAIEALEQGAASYVPKAQLADRLANTIEKVLTLARADQNYEHLINRAADAEFTLVLKNDAALIDPLVDLVQQMAVGMKFCESTERLRIGMALKEALNNALFHGSLEISADRMQNVLDKVRQGEQVGLIQDPRSEPSYRDREITVRVRLSPDEVRFVVEDEGPGFDVTDLPISNDPAALEPGRGRGLTIMRNFMDEVLFNDTGNQVTMVKRREAN